MELNEMWIVGQLQYDADVALAPADARSVPAFLSPSEFSRWAGGRRGGRVVYCGGLENRFGFTADGGSNPSLSAKLVPHSF